MDPESVGPCLGWTKTALFRVFGLFRAPPLRDEALNQLVWRTTAKDELMKAIALFVVNALSSKDF